MFGHVLLQNRTEQNIYSIDLNSTVSRHTYFDITKDSYEGCSNMNASSFITFFTYMLRQNLIRFLKELFVAF